MGIFKDNKKGMMDDLFDFLFTTLMAILILLLLGTVMQGSITSHEEAIMENKERVYASQALLTYLRAPVDNSGTTMADLIILGENNESIRALSGELTKALIEGSNNPLFLGVSVNYPSLGYNLPIYFSVSPAGTSLYASVSLLSISSLSTSLPSPPSTSSLSPSSTSSSSTQGKEIQVMLMGKMMVSEGNKIKIIGVQAAGQQSLKAVVGGS